MVVQTFPSGPFATNAYVAYSQNTKEAVIIDPAPGSAPAIIRYMEENGLKANGIILTHSHWDHTADIAALRKWRKMNLVVHPLDAENVRSPGSDKLPLLMEIEGAEPDILIEDSERVAFGDCEFFILHTPGHTPGGICLFEVGHRILFSGDTFFQGSIGNLSFPTADPEAMWDSLKNLATLPPETVVYPGHGPKTTVAQEILMLKNAKELFGG